MDLWIPITIAAAFFQNVRSALQKHMKGQLSNTGATFIRFGYGAPFALVYVAVLASLDQFTVPTPNATFALYTVTGGVTQILATALLLYSFSFRNFTVGTTYSKTETVQTAIIGIVILGDHLTTGAMVAILVSLVGVMTLSVARGQTSARALLTAWTEKPALIGIGSGTLFGASAVSYRAASLSLGGDGFLIQAAFTLACAIVLQTAITAVYMRVREPGQLTTVLKSWRVSTLVGLSGMLGSVGWFTAMTIQNAAYVRALGQIELVFTFIVSYFFFHERTNRIELFGIGLILGGILLLLLG